MRPTILLCLAALLLTASALSMKSHLKTRKELSGGRSHSAKNTANETPSHRGRHNRDSPTSDTDALAQAKTFAPSWCYDLHYYEQVPAADYPDAICYDWGNFWNPIEDNCSNEIEVLENLSGRPANDIMHLAEFIFMTATNPYSSPTDYWEEADCGFWLNTSGCTNSMGNLMDCVYDHADFRDCRNDIAPTS